MTQSLDPRHPLDRKFGGLLGHYRLFRNKYFCLYVVNLTP